jgi:integrase/recombinase XerD
LRLLAGSGDPKRKLGRILSSALLLELGLRHAASGEAAAPLEAAKRLRDGLMIATLALMPIRVGSFRSLSLGCSFFTTESEIVVALNEDQTKTGAPWEAAVPEIVEPLMRRYLAETRPWLMAQWGERHDVLWVNDRGRPYAETYLGQKIATVTTRLTGIRVPPHFFRDSAATTLARVSPRASKLIHPVLGHSDFRMAQKHYNHATALEAGRDYAAVIARMKREAK